MGLKKDAVASLVAAMAVTRKGLKEASREGGHFYFVGDAKGRDGALIVFGPGKDGDGKKTFRTGRGLLQVFKKGGVKPVYSQGSIQSGSPLVFAITNDHDERAVLVQVSHQLGVRGALGLVS